VVSNAEETRPVPTSADATLGTLPKDSAGAAEEHGRRISPLFWIVVVLFVLVGTYHYFFQLLPLSRIAEFKRAVAESHGDWTVLEPAIKALHLKIESTPVMPGAYYVDLCSAQTAVKQWLFKVEPQVPGIPHIGDFICLESVRISTDPAGRQVRMVKYNGNFSATH
jgi:hypothetical protein